MIHSFTLDELYTHFRCFEEKLRQAEELKHETKSIALLGKNSKSHNSSNNRYSNDFFIQNISKDVLLLSKMFLGMFNFERKHNKERTFENKKMVCFACHREWHTIRTCFKLFSNLKNQEEGEIQDQNKENMDTRGKRRLKQCKLHGVSIPLKVRLKNPTWSLVTIKNPTLHWQSKLKMAQIQWIWISLSQVRILLMRALSKS